jgi:hypothetical protein
MTNDPLSIIDLSQKSDPAQIMEISSLTCAKTGGSLQ